jgi:hypothetical protein
MHIAYSALHPEGNKTSRRGRRHHQRTTGYHQACKKYRLEIIAIQKYYPGWMPPF